MERDLETLRTYEFYAFARETSAAVELGPISFKHGLIAPSFSELDLTSSLDLVSVFDLREPGLREPEDVRLPVWASRLGSQWGGNSLEAIIIHEPRYDLRSPPFGPFGPVKGQLEVLGSFLIGNVSPMVGLSPLEIRKKRTPLHTSKRFCDTRIVEAVWTLPCLPRRSSTRVGELDNVEISPWLQPSSNIFELTLLHRRYEIAAMGLATSLGSWLLEI